MQKNPSGKYCSAAESSPASTGPGEASEPVNGPISDEQIKEMRILAEQIEAAEPGFRDGVLNPQLKARGFNSLRAMSRQDGINLLHSLSAKIVKLRMEGKLPPEGGPGDKFAKADAAGN